MVLNAAKSWLSIADDNVVSLRANTPIPPSPIELQRLALLRELEVERGVLSDHDDETVQIEHQYQAMREQRAAQREQQVERVNEINRRALDMVNRLGEPEAE